MLYFTSESSFKKQENAWSNQYDKPEFVEDVLKTYPARNEEILSWNTDVERAMKDLISVQQRLENLLKTPGTFSLVVVIKISRRLWF